MTHGSKVMPTLETIRTQLNALLTGNVTLPPDDARYRRLLLLNAGLLCGALATLFFAPFDLFVTGYYSQAAAEALACLGYVGTLFYLRRTRDIDGASIAAVLVNMFIILAIVISSGTRDFALFWLALFPPVPFFLLGATRGLLFTLVFYGIAFFVIGEGMDRWEAAELNGIALFNISGTLFGLVVFVYYYEVSRAEAQRSLESAANTDFLTGLPNRRRFQAQFEIELERANRHNLPLSLLLIDIDHFKRINDTHGHDVGDEVIRRVAEVLLDNVRTHDGVARLGGEEFGVLLPHTGALQAARVAEKLRDAVERGVLHRGSEVVPFTISVGIAENGPSRADFDALFAAADARLYRAKQNGRNRVVGA